MVPAGGHAKAIRHGASGPGARGARLGLIALVWVALCAAITLANGESRDTAVATAETRLSPIIASWQEQHATTVDPRLLRELAGEYVHAQIILRLDYTKDPPQPNAKVEDAFTDDSWLSDVTHTHLTVLSQSPQETETFFSRLAAAVDIDAEGSGWPSVAINGYVLNDLSDQLPEAALLLISDQQPSSTYSRHRKFLVGPGKHVVRERDGASWEFTVSPPATQQSIDTLPTPARSGRTPPAREQ